MRPLMHRGTAAMMQGGKVPQFAIEVAYAGGVREARSRREEESIVRAHRRRRAKQRAPAAPALATYVAVIANWGTTEG